MTDLEYWKLRCERAEEFIMLSPYEPDITKKQFEAYNRWLDIKVKEKKLESLEHKHFYNGC